MKYLQKTGSITGMNHPPGLAACGWRKNVAYRKIIHGKIV